MARLRTAALKVFIVIVVYILLTAVFFPVLWTQTNSMRPTIITNDRFVFSAMDFRNVFPFNKFISGYFYKRGDVVALNIAEEKPGTLKIIFDKFIRIMTAGYAGYPGVNDTFFIKRVIGLPGDEISMVNYVMYVRPADSPYTLSEYELSGKRLYKTSIPETNPAHGASLPFSGNMEAFTLGEDEYFVLSDDRATTNDSRTWGPVRSSALSGKALLRYWPFTRLSLM